MAATVHPQSWSFARRFIVRRALMPVLLVLLATAAPAAAADCRAPAAGGSGDTAAVAPDTALPSGLRSLVDELGGEARRGRFAGAVVTYVRGPEITSCTFGQADASRSMPIDPARTRFYVGSITKTFTGLAIAQLVHSGRIRSIDDPANRYLKRLQLEDSQGAAITIRHLLTHTAGFEDRVAGVGTARSAPVPVTADEIARLQPAEMLRPGFVTAYSNFGAAVLGLIVEDVTGQSAENYFRKNIWLPLGMTRTGFATGLSPSQDTVRAQLVRDGAMQPFEYLAFHPLYWPVGAIIATPFDMGRYLQAQVREAGPPGFVPLAPPVFELSHRRLFANHAGVNGFAMLIMDGRWNGRRFLVHGGAWPSYNSMLMAFPERGEGFFASVASLNGSPDPLDIVELSDRLATAIAGPRNVTPQPPRDRAALQEYAGAYLTCKRNETGPEKLFRFLSPSAGVTDVRVDDRGRGLLINGRGPFEQAGRDLFAWPGFRFDPADAFASHQYGFMRDGKGRVAALSDNFGLWGSIRVTGLADPRLLRSAALWMAPLLLLGPLLPFWHRADPRGRTLHWLVALQPLLLASIPALLFANHDEGGLNYYLLRGETLRFSLAGAAGTAILVLAAANLWGLVHLLKGARLPERGRRLLVAHEALVLLASLPLCWLLVGTNLAFAWARW